MRSRSRSPHVCQQEYPPLNIREQVGGTNDDADDSTQEDGLTDLDRLRAGSIVASGGRQGATDAEGEPQQPHHEVLSQEEEGEANILRAVFQASIPAFSPSLNSTIPPFL